MAEPQGVNTSRGIGQGTQNGRSGAGSASRGSMDHLTDSASEMWDTAYDQGQRYYRRGSQAIGQLDGTTLTGLFVAGAVGFGLAWLLFGHQGRYADDVARRMSQSSDQSRREGHRGTPRR